MKLSKMIAELEANDVSLNTTMNAAFHSLSHQARRCWWETSSGEFNKSLVDATRAAQAAFAEEE